uniref:Uncharacterized protein n=1 Tax=Triticum urartu TaxID=4572 RepID=A0A8R7VE61_TRIUA
MAERRSSVRRHIGGERNLLSSNQVKRDCWFKGNPYFNMISSNSTKSGVELLEAAGHYATQRWGRPCPRRCCRPTSVRASPSTAAPTTSPGASP